MPKVAFDNSFYEDLDLIISYSRLFYCGDHNATIRFVNELLAEIEEVIANEFVSGVSETVAGQKIQSVLIRQVFRVYFVERKTERRVVYLRATKMIR